AALLAEVEQALEKRKIARGKPEAPAVAQPADRELLPPPKEAEPPVEKKAEGIVPPPGKENLAEQVRKAIEDGKKFLPIDQIKTDDGIGGHWEIDINSKGRKGGWTSMALLALLSAGEDPKSQVIERGLNYLRTIDPADTYVVGLQTMVFVEAGYPEDLTRIQR